MEEGHEFVAKDIVWAKVSPYPWWPAEVPLRLSKITKIIS